MYQKGVVHLLPLLLFFAVLAGIGVYLLMKGTAKLPSPGLFEKEPTVETQSVYKNPFDENTQYVNPFDQYKSPFLSLQ